MTDLHRIIPSSVRERALAELGRWQAFAGSPLGERLVPLYAALLGAGVGVLVADRLVRSMWRHAIFTGPAQWRTVALLLTVFWIAIGAVAAIALLGPPDDATAADTDAELSGRSDEPNPGGEYVPATLDLRRSRR